MVSWVPLSILDTFTDVLNVFKKEGVIMSPSFYWTRIGYRSIPFPASSAPKDNPSIIKKMV